MTTTAVTKKQKSYFTAETVNRYFLDDGESFIEHKPLNEGLFQAYQDLTSRIKLDREGESTEVDMALGKQRQFLTENLVTNWNLVDDENKPIKYTPERLKSLPPHIIGGLVDDIYKTNEILSGDVDEDSGKKS